jgi:hypothetical protein
MRTVTIANRFLNRPAMWHNLVGFKISPHFLESEVRLKRKLTSISVMPIDDETKADLDLAIANLTTHQEFANSNRVVRHEINVRYINGDEIRGEFLSKTDAIEFLQKLK